MKGVLSHEELVSVRRKEVSERLKEAISYGDLSENSEYDSAKNEQAELEERILKLENMIRKAKIINEEEMNADQVSVGRATERDLARLQPYLAEYCALFGLDEAGILDAAFVVVTPDTGNPYKQMYVAN